VDDYVLVMEDVEAGYEDHRVLKGVSLRVRRGERVVVMGPSGSGKSTLLKTAVLLVKPWKGRIVLDGVEVTARGVDIRKVRAKTGFVFQSYNLFPHMTVLDNIVLPQILVKKVRREEAVKRAHEVLREVGLEGVEHKYPLQLSGGQQQRVAIARALAMDPIIFFLDEPTSALDPELKEEVLNTLEKVAQEGIAMLIVTHELDFAEDVADRIIFMENGVVVEEGEPHKILYNPEKDRTKEFLRSIRRRRLKAEALHS